MEIFWDYLTCGMSLCLCLLVILYCFMRVTVIQLRVQTICLISHSDQETDIRFLSFCCFEVSISSFDVFHGLLVPFLNDLIFTLKLYSPFKEWRYKVLCKPAFN